MRKIGRVFYEEQIVKETYINLIKSLNLRSPVVIKPNWGFSICFTEADVLDWTLEACKGETIIAESYGWARSREMLTEGTWGSFKKKDLRKSDEWFLEYSGIDKILKKYNVEYLNITEEYWGNRIVDREIMRDAVDKTSSPLVEEVFYGFIPERLYELRNGSLLSLSKLRTLESPMWVSLSVKNLFGMIPGPSRGEFHGDNHKKLNQSIVDIYKIYNSLFEVRGVVEAIFTASLRDRTTLEWSELDNLRFASASHDPLTLDAVITELIGLTPQDVGYLRLMSENFGSWDENSVMSMKDQVSIPLVKLASG